MTTTAKHDRPHRGGPTDPAHDEDLRRGILRTDVARPIAGVLLGTFVLVIAAVPIGQTVRDAVTGDDFVLRDLFRRAPTRDNIKQVEEDLEKASTVRAFVRPRVQALLTRWGGFGNSKAVVGRGGWLFYGPGVAAVGGPGFLDLGVQRARQKAALDAGDPALFPDPRPAILDFARFLARRGIALVVLLVPDKAGLQPNELHGRAGTGAREPAKNADSDRLAAELRAANVWVLDPSPERLAPGAAPYFLVQDTHWTPAWMHVVAGQLARLLVEQAKLPALAPRIWRTVPRVVARVGDVTDMLGLPDDQKLFAPEEATVLEVRDAQDRRFEPNGAADVLLLGDSFTNVFSLEPMGWGEGAGFGAHLAAALGRDVDVIAQNDSGSFATRQLLWNALAGGEDRLKGKRAVVWEFAARELAVGNWKPLDWSGVDARAPAQARP
jgi:alginate O-acetyltransferase complex protein AlgJ